MTDEGYTKYACDWRASPPLPPSEIAELNAWRNRLYEAGLIGYDAEHGVGFGNVSVRKGASGQFIISGTQTGHIARTDARHYATVVDYDIAGNRLTCEGPVQASSEALTHAALYALNPAIHAVVHIHSRALWQRLLDRVPTTSLDVSYGTPEMAREFARLYRDTGFAETGLAAMAGHEDGIVTFGSTVEEAVRRIPAAQ